MPIEKVGDIRLEDPRIWVGLSATIKYKAVSITTVFQYLSVVATYAASNLPQS